MGQVGGVATDEDGAYVYILESEKTRRYYVGWSADPWKRLESHNAGAVRATRYQLPWVLRYTEAQPSGRAARQRELYLKRLKSRRALEALMGGV
jgi:putative endonuclease